MWISFVKIRNSSDTVYCGPGGIYFVMSNRMYIKQPREYVIEKFNPHPKPEENLIERHGNYEYDSIGPAKTMARRLSLGIN